MDNVINQSHSNWQYDFFINPASTLMPLAFLYVLIIYLWLLVTKYILISTELKCTQNIKLYHFVHTILSTTILSGLLVHCSVFCLFLDLSWISNIYVTEFGWANVVRLDHRPLQLQNLVWLSSTGISMTRRVQHWWVRKLRWFLIQF